jgi:hypothetical protein
VEATLPLRIGSNSLGAAMMTAPLPGGKGQVRSRTRKLSEGIRDQLKAERFAPSLACCVLDARRLLPQAKSVLLPQFKKISTPRTLAKNR